MPIAPCRRAAEPCAFLDLDGDTRVELLPDARHGKQDVRRHLAQVLRHGVGSFREIHHVHRGDVVVAADEPLGDVAQGEEVERVVGLLRIGSMRLKAPTWKMTLRCVSMAPLAGPVVPEV